MRSQVGGAPGGGTVPRRALVGPTGGRHILVIDLSWSHRYVYVVTVHQASPLGFTSFSACALDFM